VLSVTLLSPAMEIHKTGCGDIARSIARRQTTKREQVEGSQVYEGETFKDLLFEVDSDLASWFGETIEHRPSAWRWDNCSLAPCTKGMDDRTKQEREDYINDSYPD
jgi:hypothetical protein